MDLLRETENIVLAPEVLEPTPKEVCYCIKIKLCPMLVSYQDRLDVYVEFLHLKKFFFHGECFANSGSWRIYVGCPMLAGLIARPS